MIGPDILSWRFWAWQQPCRYWRVARLETQAVAAQSPLPVGQQVIPPPHPPNHTRPFVDGATNPDGIPDEVAYRLFLRMLMTPVADTKSAAMQRSYIRHVLRTGAVLLDASHTDHAGEDCATHQHSSPTVDEIESVIRFVQSYEPALRDLDRTSRMKRERGDLIGAQGTARDRDDLVLRVMETLPGRVSAQTAEKLHAFARHHVRKNTKIFL